MNKLTLFCVLLVAVSGVVGRHQVRSTSSLESGRDKIKSGLSDVGDWLSEKAGQTYGNAKDLWQEVAIDATDRWNEFKHYLDRVFPSEEKTVKPSITKRSVSTLEVKNPLEEKFNRLRDFVKANKDQIVNSLLTPETQQKINVELNNLRQITKDAAEKIRQEWESEVQKAIDSGDLHVEKRSISTLEAKAPLEEKLTHLLEWAKSNKEQIVNSLISPETKQKIDVELNKLKTLTLETADHIRKEWDAEVQKSLNSGNAHVQSKRSVSSADVQAPLEEKLSHLLQWAKANKEQVVDSLITPETKQKINVELNNLRSWAHEAAENIRKEWEAEVQKGLESGDLHLEQLE